MIPLSALRLIPTWGSISPFITCFFPPASLPPDFPLRAPLFLPRLLLFGAFFCLSFLLLWPLLPCFSLVLLFRFFPRPVFSFFLFSVGPFRFSPLVAPSLTSRLLSRAFPVAFFSLRLPVYQGMSFCLTVAGLLPLPCCGPVPFVPPSATHFLVPPTSAFSASCLFTGAASGLGSFASSSYPSFCCPSPCPVSRLLLSFALPFFLLCFLPFCPLCSAPASPAFLPSPGAWLAHAGPSLDFARRGAPRSRISSPPRYSCFSYVSHSWPPPLVWSFAALPLFAPFVTPSLRFFFFFWFLLPPFLPLLRPFT